MDAFNETFKAHRRPIAGIVAIGVARTKLTEARVRQRVLVPVNPRPVQIAIQSFCSDVDGQECRFSRQGIGEDVRFALGAAGINGSHQIIVLAILTLASRKVLALCQGDTEVVQLVVQRRVVVACKSHLEAICLDNLVCGKHLRFAALVHGDAGLLEPALLLQVRAEVFQVSIP